MIVMVRVDDRLLHGQVSLGWQSELMLTRVVVADDAAAADPWEREVYEASGPEGADVTVCTLADAADEWSEWARSADRVLVLVRGFDEIHTLRAAGTDFSSGVNVGGMHGGETRTERGYGFWLSPPEVEAIRRLDAAGVVCRFQSLPTDPVRQVDDVLAASSDAS